MVGGTLFLITFFSPSLGLTATDEATQGPSVVSLLDNRKCKRAAEEEEDCSFVLGPDEYIKRILPYRYTV